MSAAKQAKAWAPATLSNLEVGFDALGLALPAPRDQVRALRVAGRGVRALTVEPYGLELSAEPAENTAGIAARAVLERAGAGFGVELVLTKNLPLRSGLGSSAASAAAAAVAVNRLLPEPLEAAELLSACLLAETAVSGAHLDNAAAALLGGLCLVRSLTPPDVLRLPLPAGLRAAVIMPRLEVETRAARAYLPGTVLLAERTRAAAELAAFVHACHLGDLGLMARLLPDAVVSPLRARAIPGCRQALAAARELGAALCGIAGAGPALFALCPDVHSAEQVAAAMMLELARAGLAAEKMVTAANNPGALDS